MAANYGTVEATNNEKKITQYNDDTIIIGQIHHRKTACFYILLIISTCVVPPLTPWFLISWYLVEKKWKLYLKEDGIYYTNARLGCTRSWFIPLHNIRECVARGSSIYVYVHLQDFKMTGLGPSYNIGAKGTFVNIWYVRNAQRFVAAVNKQNENLTRSYHMDTVCNF